MRSLLLAAPAHAGGVASDASADLTADTHSPGNSHPGYTYEGAPEVRDPVAGATVDALRRQAIEDFGQSTTSKAEGATDSETPDSVKAHRSGFFTRIENRGGTVPDA
jgi:hypothetical protein